MLTFSNGSYNSILPYEHGPPEKRELFREQWKYFRGFFQKGPNPASAQGSPGSEPSSESIGTSLRMYPEIQVLTLLRKYTRAP